MSVTEGRIGEDSSRSGSVSLIKNTSRLPSAVVVRIAEHLISQHAFKTTASLNRISEAIHAETLPVLYETFSYDDWKMLPANRKGIADLPEAVKTCSKYIFYTTPGGDVKEFDQLKGCRSVVMTICADVIDTASYNFEAETPIRRIVSKPAGLPRFRGSEEPVDLEQLIMRDCLTLESPKLKFARYCLEQSNNCS